MSDIPAMPYSFQWEERRLCSVANLTRADGDALMKIAARTPLKIHTPPTRSNRPMLHWPTCVRADWPAPAF